MFLVLNGLAVLWANLGWRVLLGTREQAGVANSTNAWCKHPVLAVQHDGGSGCIDASAGPAHLREHCERPHTGAACGGRANRR